MAQMLSLALLCNSMGENANIEVDKTDREIKRLKYQLKNTKRRKQKMRIQQKIDELEKSKWDF